MAVPQDAPASRTIPGELDTYYEFAPNCIEIHACRGTVITVPYGTQHIPTKR